MKSFHSFLSGSTALISLSKSTQNDLFPNRLPTDSTFYPDMWELWSIYIYIYMATTYTHSSLHLWSKKRFNSAESRCWTLSISFLSPVILFYLPLSYPMMLSVSIYLFKVQVIKIPQPPWLSSPGKTAHELSVKLPADEFSFSKGIVCGQYLIPNIILSLSCFLFVCPMKVRSSHSMLLNIFSCLIKETLALAECCLSNSVYYSYFGVIMGDICGDWLGVGWRSYVVLNILIMCMRRSDNEDKL